MKHIETVDKRSRERLADAIAADILRERPETPDLDHCFLCKRAFTPGKGFGLNGRFCSPLCLDAYDAGYIHREPKPPYDFPVRGDGFLFNCRNCQKPFVSKGLRCCSTECERKYRDKEDIAKTLAEIGEAPPTAKRQCEHCGNPLPRYVGTGKKRKQSTKRFCSPRCQQAAKKAGIVPAKGSSQGPSQSASDIQEVPIPSGPAAATKPSEPSRFSVPVDLIGHASHRFPGPRLEAGIAKAIIDEEVPP
jgi:hypothetical protein